VRRDPLYDIAATEAKELQTQGYVEDRTVLAVPLVEGVLSPADGLLGAIAELTGDLTGLLQEFLFGDGERNQTSLLGVPPRDLLAGEATDGQVAAVPAMLAERLGVAQLTGARKLDVDGATLTIERQTEDGYQVVQAATPAIVSVWDTINEPRYPSFKGIMQAKSKPVSTLGLAELGIGADEVGLGNATSEVVEFAPRPAKQAGVKITDEGDGGAKLVGFLAAQKFI